VTLDATVADVYFFSYVLRCIRVTITVVSLFVDYIFRFRLGVLLYLLVEVITSF